MTCHKKHYQRGFTLVELSIVIVIIGLIVAGVVAGQSLVRQAKIRGIVTDFNKYNTAINAFILEYNGIPGDFDNAFQLGLGTNGNGNGSISGKNTENLYSWAHLANSGIIVGSYTGTDLGNPNTQIGENIPASSFGNGVGVYLSSISRNTQNCVFAANNNLYGNNRTNTLNVLSFGRTQTSGFGCASLPFLKVSEAHGLDNKMDDGQPDSGVLFSANENNTNVDGNRCVDSPVQGTTGANYDFDEQGESCRLIFITGS